MKRILLALLAVLCVIAFVSCRENEQNINNEENSVQENPTEVSKDAPDLVKLKKTIVDNGANLGVAYLGYNEGTFSDVKRYFGESGLYEVYPFVEDMELDRYCVTGGDEHYLIVPTDDAELVQVYIGVPNFETYGVDRGELVFEATDGKPFIVRGNESEIVSNIIIVCGELEYTPYLSGEEGRLVATDKILDFSPYEAVNEYFGIEIDDSNALEPILN